MDPRSEPLCLASAGEIAERIRTRQVSCLATVEAHLARIDQVNPALNAVVAIDRARALETARLADQAIAEDRPLGPLHGVPITLKDSLDTAGLVTTGGTEGRRHFQPTRDATVVARLRQAGAILLGKTNTPELTMGVGTYNEIHGRTNNPYDLARSPSGSSGGAAAILAAGGAALELGSDTGGSIREPAHVCGIAGLKPTAGRVPLTGHIIPFDFGAIGFLTQVGPMARRVDDLSLALAVIAGPDGIDPSVAPVPLEDPNQVRLDGLRVAWFTANGVIAADDQVAEVVERAARALSDQGALVRPAVPGGIACFPRLYERLCLTHGLSPLRRLLTKLGTAEPGADLARRMAPLGTAEPGALSAVLEEVERYRSHMLGFLADVDVILCPPAIEAAVRHEDMRDDDLGLWSFLTPFNLTGWPAVVVPAGATAEGLPLGVQLVAGPWHEHLALAAAKVVERQLGGYRPPDLARLVGAGGA